MLKSIRFRIMASHVAIVLLVILILGPVSYYLFKHHLLQEQSANLQFVAHHVSGMLDQRVTQLEKQLEQVSNSRVVQDFPDTARVAALGEYFSRFRDTFPVLGYLDARGWEEVKVIKGHRLSYLENHEDLDLFRYAKTHPGQSAVGGITFSDNLEIPAISVVYGLKRYFGDTFVGAVYGKAPLSALTGFLRHIDVGKTGYVCLVEESGRILYYPDPSRVLTGLSEEVRNSPLMQKVRSVQDGVTEDHFMGTHGLIAYAPVERLNARLLVVLPYAELMAAPGKARNTIVLTLAGILVFGVIGAMLLANRLTRPIQALTKGVAQISEGGLPGEIEMPADGEIGELVATFNLMVRELRKSTISRHYFERIMGCMQEGLVLVALDGTIRNANKAACDLIGKSEKKLTGRGIDEFFNLPASESGDWLHMFLGESGSRTSIKTLKTASRGEVKVDFVWSVLENATGEVSEIACLFLVRDNRT